MSQKFAPQVQALLVDLGKADVNLLGAKNNRTVAEKQAEVAALKEEKTKLRRQAAGTQIRAQDLDWDIDRLKSDLDKLVQRTAAEEAAVKEATDPEEARDLKFDLRATRRRMAELEADLAAAQQHRDAYEGHHDSAGANTDSVAAELEIAERDLAAVQESTNQRITNAQTAVDTLRERILAAAPNAADALDLYDRHAKEAGIGAAKLRGRICGACGMELPNATVAELTALPLDEMGECPECGTLLVRGATLDLVLGARSQ